MVRRTLHLRLVWNAGAPAQAAPPVSAPPDLTPRAPTAMPAGQDTAAAILVRDAVGGPSGFLWRVAEVLSLVSVAPRRLRIRAQRPIRAKNQQHTAAEHLPS